MNTNSAVRRCSQAPCCKSQVAIYSPPASWQRVNVAKQSCSIVELAKPSRRRRQASGTHAASGRASELLWRGRLLCVCMCVFGVSSVARPNAPPRPIVCLCVCVLECACIKASELFSRTGSNESCVKLTRRQLVRVLGGVALGRAATSRCVTSLTSSSSCSTSTCVCVCVCVYLSSGGFQASRTRGRTRESCCERARLASRLRYELACCIMFVAIAIAIVVAALRALVVEELRFVLRTRAHFSRFECSHFAQQARCAR